MSQQRGSHWAIGSGCPLPTIYLEQLRKIDSSLRSLEGTLSQSLWRVTLDSLEKEKPVSMTKQRKSVLGCLQPREVSPKCLSPYSLEKLWKIMGESFQKTKGERIYLQLTLGDSFPGASDTSEAIGLSLRAPSAVLLPELSRPRPGAHCCRPAGDRGWRQSRNPTLSPFHRLVLMVKSKAPNCLCSGLLRMRGELLFS